MSIKLKLAKVEENVHNGVGDVIVSPNYHPPGQCPYWSNCDGTHIIVMFPHPSPKNPNQGVYFDITSRASNCGKPADRTHRCWVVHGAPPDLHVDKAGETCNAGVGSFQIGKWHGFIKNGHIE